ncbi:MAG: TraR/DksA family transcriptional regulator [Candidatus Aminicenantia bacterium]
MPSKGCEMDQKSLEKYQKSLLKRKEEIIKKLNKDYDLNELIVAEIVQDIADRAESTYSKEFLYSLTDAEREQLTMIDEALNRIKEKTYGSCQRCGKKITKKRLDAIPWAKYCIECQQKLEEGSG